MTLHLGPLLVAQDLVRRQARSAMPDAPIVPHRTKAPALPRLPRTRALTAAVLFRAAARVGPA
jgi:hypothetical protein